MKINSVQSTTPSYKGYLHKSVYKYINTASKNAKTEIHSLDAKVSKAQMENTINYIDNIRKETLANLELFIKKCHPKSYLIIEERQGEALNLNLNNQKLKLNFGIPGASLLRLGENSTDNELILPTRSENHSGYYNDNDLKQLQRYSKRLVLINPKSADSAILNSFTHQENTDTKSFWGKVKQKRNNKKIITFSNEIGKSI